MIFYTFFKTHSDIQGENCRSFQKGGNKKMFSVVYCKNDVLLNVMDNVFFRRCVPS